MRRRSLDGLGGTLSSSRLSINHPLCSFYGDPEAGRRCDDRSKVLDLNLTARCEGGAIVIGSLSICITSGGHTPLTPMVRVFSLRPAVAFESGRYRRVAEFQRKAAAAVARCREPAVSGEIPTTDSGATLHSFLTHLRRKGDGAVIHGFIMHRLSFGVFFVFS